MAPLVTTTDDAPSKLAGPVTVKVTGAPGKIVFTWSVTIATSGSGVAQVRRGGLPAAAECYHRRGDPGDDGCVEDGSLLERGRRGRDLNGAARRAGDQLG